MTGQGAAGPKPRVRLLDALRGFSVVSMVAYHAMFDLVYMYGVNAPWYHTVFGRLTPGYLWQQSICWVFILVSGASLHYGRGLWRRGLVTLGCAMALTLVTWLVLPDMRITFGVLHMLGASMLLAAALRPLLQRVPPVAGLLAGGALFILTRGVPMGYLGLLDTPVLWLPGSWYQSSFLFPLGFPGPGFRSSDYFSLIPWFFLFMAGYFAWALLKDRVKPAPPGKNPLEWIGRHSLVIYMLHQPVIYGACMLLAAVGVL